MSDSYVYVGPSLAADEVRRLLPGARILPPVRHGDLLAIEPGAGDRVLIIDGLFLHAAPVRHREILHLLDRGVVVAGAASMGALRAAELWRFGMRGVGEVFRLYRDGVVSGDDEVAIVHGPAEEGHRPLSEPLVNIRVALREAVAARVIPDTAATALLELGRGLPFRLRTYRGLGRVGRQHLPASIVDRFLDWAGAHAVDTKAADARLLLAMAAGDDPALRPHGPGDQPVVNLRTHHMRSWQARFGGCGRPGATRAQVVTAVMLTHPAFPAEHRRQVFADLLGARPDDSTVDDRVLELARRRGLDGDTRSWLVPAEYDLPEPERLRRLVYRAFGAGEYRRLSPSRLPASLDTAAVLDAARNLVVTAENLNRQIPGADRHRPGSRLRFRTEVVERTFADLWGTDATRFQAAVWDRGYAHREAFHTAAEPLVAYLKMAGRPDFAST